MMWYGVMRQKHTLGSLSKLCRTRIMNSASPLLGLASPLVGVAGAMIVELGVDPCKGVQ